MMLELLTSHDDQDLCFRESGHLQQQQNQAVVSTSILQSRTTAKCNQVHDGSLLSWSVSFIPKLVVIARLTKLLAPSPAHRIFLWCAAGATTMALSECMIMLFA
jgi:hypothetical protein